MSMVNDSFLRACWREDTPHTPVWLMRQAGRYLSEYRATRSKAGSFMGLATSPAFATEVTLQPLARFDLDAAILFSDILTVPDAMGLGLSFAEGEGPRFARPLRDEAAVMALRAPPMEKLRYVFDAVASIRKALDGRVPLIGFAGSPWTLACYMVEGGSSKDYRTIKTMLYSRPDLLERILAHNADAVAAYLNLQIEHGAQAVMVFDSWGGVLADGAFQRFSLQYTARVLRQLKREHAGARIPRIVFTKGGSPWLKEMQSLDCQVLGLDWTVNMAQAMQSLGKTHALQGNLDPSVLFASAPQVAAEAERILDSVAQGNLARGEGVNVNHGHIFNLGHGIDQHTPPDNVQVLVDTVHAYSRALRERKSLL